MLEDSGTEESVRKACSLDVQLIFLGVIFYTSDMTLSITQERLEELKGLLVYWLELEVASKKDMQSIIGKLNFVAACVRQRRMFIARLINHMKVLPVKGKHHITNSVKKYLFWWSVFLQLYNGICMMATEEWSQVDEVFASDACLQGCGSRRLDREYFHTEFPKEVKQLQLQINCLEMLAIIVSCKIWGHRWQGRRIVIHCNNMVSVTLMNTGRTKDQCLQSCLKELAFIAGRYEFGIPGVHIAGLCNRVPDILSRWKHDGSS